LVRKKDEDLEKKDKEILSEQNKVKELTRKCGKAESEKERLAKEINKSQE